MQQERGRDSPSPLRLAVLWKLSALTSTEPGWQGVEHPPRPAATHKDCQTNTLLQTTHVLPFRTLHPSQSVSDHVFSESSEAARRMMKYHPRDVQHRNMPKVKARTMPTKQPPKHRPSQRACSDVAHLLEVVPEAELQRDAVSLDGAHEAGQQVGVVGIPGALLQAALQHHPHHLSLCLPLHTPPLRRGHLTPQHPTLSLART